MGKCTCSIHGEGGAFASQAERVPDDGATWPMICTECGKELLPGNRARVGDFLKEGLKAICGTCYEIGSCFLCGCSCGNLWPALRRNYQKIGLGNLTELLSPEAKAVLIEKVDEWMEEDNELGR